MVYGDRDRPREPFPATPFLFLQERESILEWSVNSWMIWNTISIGTSDFYYKEGKSKIFILTSGFYEIMYDLSTYVSSGDLSSLRFAIWVNETYIQGSRVYRSGSNYIMSVTGRYYIYLNSGDYVRLACYVGTGGGTASTIVDTVRMSIKGLSMYGWNNLRGGTDDKYTGE